MSEQSDIQKAAREVLASALQIDTAEVTNDMALGQSDRWDSLAHMRLVMAIEERLGRAIGTEEMLSIENIPSIESVLNTVI